MEIYSRSILFFFHMAGLVIGRYSFVLSLILWVFAISNGTKNIATNSVIPEPILTNLAILFGFLWAIGISIYFILSFFLRCDRCGKLNIWYTLSKEPENFTLPRNKIVRFFLPNEIMYKQYTCPHCNTDFKLGFK